MATRPVVASHTGVRGVADNARNLSDEHLRGIAATGGLIGIGFWPTACGGDDVAAIARSISYAIDVAGVRPRRRSAPTSMARVQIPFDATGMVRITEALLGAGFDGRRHREGDGRQRDPAVRRGPAGHLSRVPRRSGDALW